MTSLSRFAYDRDRRGEEDRLVRGQTSERTLRYNNIQGREIHTKNCEHPEMGHNWVSVIIVFSVVYSAEALIPHRYHFVNESKNWSEAQIYCREKYTDLATINNMEEMKKLNHTLKTETAERAWIGLQREGTGEWQWSLADQTFYRDGDTYRNWRSGEPNNCKKNEFCVQLIMNYGSWNDEQCNEKRPFVCYEDKLILIKENLTWKEALRYCRNHHYDLVSVRTEEMQLWVKEVARNASTEHVWLGLRHTCALGFWYWVTGEMICYQDWAPGNGTGFEDCSNEERTGAVQSGGEQQWISLPQSYTLNFICSTYEG
ncbi:macrophage mannose receptor 1 isoform X2 [Pangasianodon hypophthalmus]|uniref:macrophage mannose receptor 1 isoform X2 n=1 Tax=Pangasianodon hypophthalmus TaxID=310915 RepID=UPI00230759CC|nr:macrophage mannose receptor 1 isoform X2 [Pangasianodon hypophthalmus]